MFQKNKITNNIEPTKPSKNLAAKLVLLSASTVSIAGLIGSSITYANTTTNNTQDNTSSKSAIIAKTNSTASAGAKLAPKLAPKLDSKLDSKSIKLINTITKNQVKILNSFSAVTGMRGYVVAPKQDGGQKMIIYVGGDGDFAFFGNIISAEGKNLSKAYQEKYIVSMQAVEAYPDLAATNYFTQGSDSAPHKAYILMDPNCGYCHKLYFDLKPLVKANKIQIRWVPVGIMRQDSLAKVAKLLSAKNSAQALKWLDQGEISFNNATEESGVTPLDPASTNPMVTNAFRKSSENNAFFSKHSFYATPMVLYLDKQGKPSLLPGYPNGPEALNKLLNKMSDKFETK